MNIRKELRELTEIYNFPIQLDYTYKNGDNFQDFCDTLNDEIFCLEMIYYSGAIDYLKENDNSLRESLEIASEHCYQIDYLSSEVLATLLYQKRTTELWYNKISDKVEKLFKKL